MQTFFKTVLDSPANFSHQDLETLLNLGGFPEPFFKGSESFWKRWQIQHNELLIEEDLRDWNHNKNGVHIFSANRFLELLP